MPGASINPRELSALQTSIDCKESPDGVLKVLSGAEYRAYLSDLPVQDILILRKAIWRGIALPDGFKERVKIFTDLALRREILENSNQIAILCRCLEEIERKRAWVIDTLARHHTIGPTEILKRKNIENQLQFAAGRNYLDGPVVVTIVEDKRHIADQILSE